MTERIGSPAAGQRSESQSAALYAKAHQWIPDGVSRATLLRRPNPIYVDHGKGAWVTDVDGNRYLDCNNNFTSIIVGHANPAVAQAVSAQMARGTAFALASNAEIELASLLCERVESFELIRFCNSGTEAVMGALKAARAFTGRPNVIKVEGAYHGTYDHAEASLASSPADWGDAAAPVTVPYSFGTPHSVTEEVSVIHFNDAVGAQAAIRSQGDRLAAVLLDVMPSQVGLPTIEQDFIDAVRETTREVGALLVLDEVISFRLGYSGAQALLGIDPDLTAVAKIIGGGFPVGGVAGREGPMSTFARAGSARAKVPSGGTFTANPVTMAAGHAAMSQLDRDAFARLDELGDAVRSGLRSAIDAAGANWQVTGRGSLFKVHPHTRHIRNYRDAHLSSDEAAELERFEHAIQAAGVYLSGGGFGSLGLATTDDDIAFLLEAAAVAFEG